MNRKTWTTTAIAAGAALMMWGCEDSTTSPYDGTTFDGRTPAEVHTETAQDYNEAAQEQMDRAQDRIEEGADQAEEMGGDVVSNARPLLDEALADINAGRLDAAEEKLNQLEDMELPEAFRQQVSNARTMLDTRRDASGAEGLIQDPMAQ